MPNVEKAQYLPHALFLSLTITCRIAAQPSFNETTYCLSHVMLTASHQFLTSLATVEFACPQDSRLGFGADLSQSRLPRWCRHLT